MPRTARHHWPGGVFHIVSRFARDEWWLARPGAREAYLEFLGSALQKTDAEVFGYCLMSNHVHLAVVQGHDPLERLTKSTHTGFAGWVSRRYGRGKALGSVFAGRPKMFLIEEEPYLLELIRYIHNNPVRARVSRYARSCAWSSHQAYLGRTKASEWLRFGYVLDRFGPSTKQARRRFDAFVNAGRKEERRGDFSGARAGTTEAQRSARQQLGDAYRVSDGIVGSEAFIARVVEDTVRIQSALSQRDAAVRSGGMGRPAAREVLDAVLAALDIDELEFSLRPRSRQNSHARRLTTWIWVREYEGQQADIARLLGVATSAVSRQYSQATVHAADYDEQASGIVATLNMRRSKRPRLRTPAEAGAHGVRYLVDVDEV